MKTMAEAQNETVKISTVSMIVCVIGFTVTMLIGFNKIVDGAVEKGVSNAIETIHLRQNITDQKQDSRMDVMAVDVRTNTIEIDKLKNQLVGLENSRK